MNAITPVWREARRPNGGVPVLWVYQDIEGYWCLHREGDHNDLAYPSRRDALMAARLAGEETGSYRLHLQVDDGRFLLELLNTADRSHNSLRGGRRS